MTERRRWEPLDFIINGEFAEAADLQACLDEVRCIARADCAVLLACHHELFQSLMHVSLPDEAKRLEMQASFTNVQLEYVQEEKDEIKSLLERAQTEEPVPMPLRSMLESNLRSNLFAELTVLFGTTRSSLVPALLPTRHSAPERNVAPVIGILLIGENHAINGLVFEKARNLGIAVCASAPVYLQRMHVDQRLQRDILYLAERKFEEQHEALAKTMLDADAGSDAGEINDKRELRKRRDQFYQRILEPILEMTQSSQGGIFIVGDKYQKLDAALRLARKQDGTVSPIFGTDFNIEGGHNSSLVVKAFRKRQAFLINDCENFKRMNPLMSIRPFPERLDVAEAFLTVPILLRGLQTKDTISLGVLNIERQSDAMAHPFTLRDYFFLQEAAGIVGHAWAHVLQDTIQERLHDVQLLLPKMPSEAMRGRRGTKTDPLTSGIQDIPIDFQDVQPDVQKILDKFFVYDDLVSACTVRVLSLDQSKLVLYARCTDADSPEIFPSFYPMDKPSLWTRVMERGTPISGRPGSPSANSIHFLLCFPLLLSTRCVGVVTFGQRFPNNSFNYHRHAMQTVTDSVAQILAFSQNYALSQILDPTTRVLADHHETQKIPSDGFELVNKAFAGLKDSRIDLSPILTGIWDQFEKLRVILTGAEPDHVVVPSGYEVSIGKLIRDAINESTHPEYFRIKDDRPHLSRSPSQRLADKVSLEHYDFCRAALIDLFKNAMNAISLSGVERIFLMLTTRTLGKRKYCCVRITNKVRLSDITPAEELPQLYRVPYRRGRGERLRCGAFHAAWLIRAIGGDIHFRQVKMPRPRGGKAKDDLYEHRVTIEIPTLNPTGEPR